MPSWIVLTLASCVWTQESRMGWSTLHQTPQSWRSLGFRPQGDSLFPRWMSAPLRPSSLHLALKCNDNQYPGHHFRPTEPGPGAGALRGTTNTASKGGFRPLLCRPSPWASKRSMRRLLHSGLHPICSPESGEVCSQDSWGVWGSSSTGVMPMPSGHVGHSASCLPKHGL